MMEKKEIIKRLCSLCTKVGENHFKNRTAHDCFCGENPLADDSLAFGFQFEEEIIKFIEESVNENLKDNQMEKETIENMPEERYRNDLEKRMKFIESFEFSITDKYAIRDLLKYLRIKETKKQYHFDKKEINKMMLWLWLQTQLEIGPVEELDSCIENLLVTDKMSDDQAINVIEILRGI